MTPAAFRSLVWRYYRLKGRHDLPWRTLSAGRQELDVYRILVSEVMLQQTQVERVIPFYKAFLKQFPTPKKLAVAPLTDVLRAWQGLGYNRRAKMLHAAAKVIAIKQPSMIEELEELPGVGPYTARAVAAFAWNEDAIFIETNIRTVIIHHFSPRKKKVSDDAIQKILGKVFPKGRAREWYSALMDYGAYLKRSGISHNARTKTYTKQSKFAGSLREARGAILREFTKGVTSQSTLTGLLGPSRRMQMKKALVALVSEGLINENLLSTPSRRRQPGRYILP